MCCADRGSLPQSVRQWQGQLNCLWQKLLAMLEGMDQLVSFRRYTNWYLFCPKLTHFLVNLFRIGLADTVYVLSFCYFSLLGRICMDFMSLFCSWVTTVCTYQYVFWWLRMISSWIRKVLSMGMTVCCSICSFGGWSFLCVHPASRWLGQSSYSSWTLFSTYITTTDRHKDPMLHVVLGISK